MAVAKFTGGGVVAKPALRVPARLAVPAAAPAARPYQPPALPPDAAYEQSVAALGSQRDVTLAGLASEKQQGLLDYGYTQDQSGGLAFDPNNPYSRAAVLKRHYDESRGSNTIGLAARGQLYSGALQNAQDYANRNELQSSDQLQKQLLAFLGRNTAAGAQAGSAYETGVGAAGSDRLQRAIETYRAMIAAGGA